MEICVRIRIFALSLVAKDRMEPDVNNNNNYPSILRRRVVFSKSLFESRVEVGSGRS